MEHPISFSEYVIVSCGTLVPEMSHLKAHGFLDARKVLFTKPGRHEIPGELESQLIEKIRIARKHSQRDRARPLYQQVGSSDPGYMGSRRGLSEGIW